MRRAVFHSTRLYRTGSILTLRRGMKSSVLDAAMSLTSPTAENPATSPKSGQTQHPDDSNVVWREYWDIPTRRPYYHNLITSEVTWQMPDKFPTRFEGYYDRYGHSR